MRAYLRAARAQRRTELLTARAVQHADASQFRRLLRGFDAPE